MSSQTIHAEPQVPACPSIMIAIRIEVVANMVQPGPEGNFCTPSTIRRGVGEVKLSFGRLDCGICGQGNRAPFPGGSLTQRREGKAEARVERGEPTLLFAPLFDAFLAGLVLPFLGVFVPWWSTRHVVVLEVPRTDRAARIARSLVGTMLCSPAGRVILWGRVMFCRADSLGAVTGHSRWPYSLGDAVEWEGKRRS